MEMEKSEFYNSYENSDMENKDQTSFYDNVSDFIFGYGESWKLLTQEEYEAEVATMDGWTKLLYEWFA